MIDSGQLLERYRHLSREIQVGLQNAQKQLGSIKDCPESLKLSKTLSGIGDAWQDFSGWVLLSTLDNLDEAKANCAPGFLDIVSKVTRSKSRRKNDLERYGIKIDTSDVDSITIETYIPYFEQMLDLIIENAIKYSLRAGHIQISAAKQKAGARITIQSIGPLVMPHEIEMLGCKEFRSESAKKLSVAGQGFGLYNVKRISSLIGAKVTFQSSAKVVCDLGGISYASFSVVIDMP